MFSDRYKRTIRERFRICTGSGARASHFISSDVQFTKQANKELYNRRLVIGPQDRNLNRGQLGLHFVDGQNNNLIRVVGVSPCWRKEPRSDDGMEQQWPQILHINTGICRVNGQRCDMIKSGEREIQSISML